MRDAGDLLDRQASPVAVADGRDRNDRRLLVDRLLEALERDLGPSAGTCTTSAPRSSCACQICPTVGNSKSLITTLRRSPNSIALASELRPAETEVVTATSSASPPTNRANVARAVSLRSTQ